MQPDIVGLASGEYYVELRRRKHQRAKLPRAVSPSRKKHLEKVGINTRFKKGEHLGAEHPRWKGGRYAKYGITNEIYDAILAKQEGKCAICGKHPKKKRLSVDHDHKTGAVRGLLCFRCNYGMGWFQEDLVRLDRVRGYLSEGKDWRCLR